MLKSVLKVAAGLGLVAAAVVGAGQAAPAAAPGSNGWGAAPAASARFHSLPEVAAVNVWPAAQSASAITSDHWASLPDALAAGDATCYGPYYAGNPVWGGIKLCFNSTLTQGWGRTSDQRTDHHCVLALYDNEKNGPIYNSARNCGNGEWILWVDDHGPVLNRTMMDVWIQQTGTMATKQVF